MTKQEEIRDWLEKEIVMTLVPCGFSFESTIEMAKELTEKWLRGLDSQGVVIKVEEEPDEETYYGDMPGEMYRNGWRRFVPLIEE